MPPTSPPADALTAEITREVNKQLVTYAVQTVMFCQATGVVLDKRRAVLISSATGKDWIVSAKRFDEIKDDLLHMLDTHPAFAGKDYTILDGRELWG